MAFDTSDRSNDLTKDTLAYWRCMQQINQPRLNDAITAVAAVLSGRKYLLDPCGEGLAGDFDPRPSARTDVFDCFTFANTALAIIASQNTPGISTDAHWHLTQLRYLEPNAQYFFRHHFVETSWTTHNRSKGYLQGSLLSEPKWQPWRQQLNLTIDYPAWLQDHQAKLPARLPFTNSATTSLRVPDFYHQSTEVTFDYLPINTLVRNAPTPKQGLIATPGPAWASLPECCLVQLICDQWSTKQRDHLGRLKNNPTPLAVVHLGFLHTQNNERFFTHAKINQSVETVPLLDYLHFLTQKAHHVSGIHLEALTYPSHAS